MILGDICTRSCGFCGVRSSRRGLEVEDDEGDRILAAVRSLGLVHVVLTSVTRDDLEDGGASHFARVIGTIREGAPGATVEVLVPDLAREHLRTVLGADPHVLGHNVEVVQSLQGKVRDPRAGYGKSLEVLRTSKEINPDVLTKSSLMIGLGESREDIIATMQDLLGAGVDILTIGQYIRPPGGRSEVARYVPPGEFRYLRNMGEEMGFRAVVSGPFVRSSYRAGEAMNLARSRVRKS
jgi:lipoic acid synthetase